MTSKSEINNDLLGMLNHTKEMLELLYEGFKKQSRDSLEKAEKLEKNLYQDSEKLLKSLLDEKSEEGIKHFIPVPEHFNRIGNGSRKMLNAIDKKVTGDVLFSDKSVTETYKLFSELQELLTCLGDCINTCNRVLIDHICGRVKDLCELADEYAVFHEERLISGVCTPINAPIYLDILDSFKSVAWHTGEITRIIASGCSESQKKDNNDNE